MIGHIYMVTSYSPIIVYAAVAVKGINFFFVFLKGEFGRLINFSFPEIHR